VIKPLALPVGVNFGDAIKIGLQLGSPIICKPSVSSKILLMIEPANLCIVVVDQG
jgi:hypothetical protein